MDEYLTPIEAERVMQMNTTCLIAYMDAGLLPFELENGVRMISRSSAIKMMRRHRKVTRQFVEFLFDQ